jgi:hypothetical protein
MELGDVIKRLQALETRVGSLEAEQKLQTAFNFQQDGRINYVKDQIESLLEALKIVKNKAKQKIITRF